MTLYWFLLPDNPCTVRKTWSTCGSTREPCLTHRYITRSRTKSWSITGYTSRLILSPKGWTRLGGGSSRYMLSQLWCSIPWHSRISYPTDWYLMPKGTRCPNAWVMPLILSTRSKNKDPILCVGTWSRTHNRGITWNSTLPGWKKWNVSSSGHCTTHTVSSPCTLISTISSMQRPKFRLTRDRKSIAGFFLYWTAWLKR